MSRHMSSIDKHKLFGGKTERKTKNVSCFLTVVKYMTYIRTTFKAHLQSPAKSEYGLCHLSLSISLHRTTRLPLSQISVKFPVEDFY